MYSGSVLFIPSSAKINANGDVTCDVLEIIVGITRRLTFSSCHCPKAALSVKINFFYLLHHTHMSVCWYAGACVVGALCGPNTKHENLKYKITFGFDFNEIVWFQFNFMTL